MAILPLKNLRPDKQTDWIGHATGETTRAITRIAPT